MREPDLIRLDDVLIRNAKTFGAAVALAFVVAWMLPDDVPGRGPMLFAGLGFAALAPLAMGFFGFALRARERRAVALMRLVDRHVELSARDLLQDSDFSPESLQTAIRDLNSSGARHVVWDRSTGLIQDGRLRLSRVHFEACASCGAKIALDVALHEASGASCPVCGSALDAREIDDAKQAVMADISARSERACAPAPPRGHFSLPIFLVLAVLFWPLAFVYCLKHWQPHDAASGL
ncbi:MAG: hypothetical protein R3F21_10360 [Myxococcota bacterium]